MKLNRLFWMYLSALAFLLTSVVASMVITEFEAGNLVEDAAKINLAGRQRMLSQRIIYLAQDLSVANSAEAVDTRAELLLAINELESAVFLFEESHGALSQDKNISQETEDLYF